MQKKIYLFGKISDDPNYREKFALKEKELTEQGHLVFNPAKHPDMFTWEQFMELDLKALGNCDSIYLLSDWQESRGAKIEYDEAVRLGKEIIFEEPSEKIEIEAPAIDLDKEEIVKLGLEVGAPIELSYSCYKGGDKHCGVCESCVRRKRAFESLKIKDKSEYEV